MLLNPEKEYGSLVVGSLFTSFLSGLTTVQALLYFRLYSREDPMYLKMVVVSVWILDFIHTAIMWEGIWFYVVANFGDRNKIEIIHHSIPTVAIITAITTITTHCFYVYRIFHFSGRKYWIACPILAVAVIRMCSSFISNAIMLRINTFEHLFLRFSWVVTVPLSLACTADVLITVSMFALLRKCRKNSLTLHHVIDRLVLYTFETGTLTGCAVIVAMLCWLILPNKLIYLGLYYPVAKSYANSLLGSLNARYHLRNMGKKEPDQVRLYWSSISFRAPQISKNSSDMIHVMQETTITTDPKPEVV